MNAYKVGSLYQDESPADGRLRELLGIRPFGVCSEEAVDDGQTLRPVAGMCAATVVMLGSMVLVGWMLGSERLMDVLPGHVTMKPNTAVGFVAAGLSLAARLVWSRRVSWLASILAGVALGVGALTLVEYGLGVDLHVDQLLFVDPVQMVYPGRMAHLTAINFCVAGGSLLMARGGRRWRLAARIAALVFAADAFVAIVAYLYGVEMFYGSMDYTSMALHTGAGFVVLGVGMVLMDGESALAGVLCANESGGVLLRRSLPWVILVPVALGWVYLRPAVNFGHPRLGMALFAVTLAAVGTGSVWGAAVSLTQQERQREEVTRHRLDAEEAARESAVLEKANKGLQEMAATDLLTGLGNRRAFEEQMRRAVAWARRTGEPLSVLMVDIDNFKMRNDTWGHAAGDEVLRRMGTLLAAGVREPDVAARFGGEEFTVLLPGSDGKRARAVAERLREAVAGQVWSEAQVTVSIGVGGLRVGMESGDEMLRTADMALYRAKQTGKNRVCGEEPDFLSRLAVG